MRAALEPELTLAVNAAAHSGTDDPCGFVALHLLARSGTEQEPVSLASPGDGNAWTAVGWLASQEIAIAVAEALLHRRSAATELEAMQALGSGGVEALTDTIVKGGLVQRLVARLHPKLMALAAGEEVDSGVELHHKFVQEGNAFTFKYGDIASFYGGLEAKIGAPDNKILEAMRREHTAEADSSEQFTSSNYGVTTSPATEWAFVTEPEQRTTWPAETRIDPSHARAPLPLRSFAADEDTLEKKLDEVNERLAALGESSMLIE